MPMIQYVVRFCVGIGLLLLTWLPGHCFAQPVRTDSTEA